MPQEERAVKKRLASRISLAAILVFAIAVVGELSIEVVQPGFARPGYLMNIAIPLAVNLLLIGAIIEGSVGLGSIQLSKSASPIFFYLTFAIAFLILNGLVLYAMRSHWFVQS